MLQIEHPGAEQDTSGESKFKYVIAIDNRVTVRLNLSELLPPF